MSTHNTARGAFEHIKQHALSLARSEELISGYWRSERSEFVRFTQGVIRQSGSVEQLELSLSLRAAQRQASLELTLCGVAAQDAQRLERALERLRALLPALPQDPHLPPTPEPVVWEAPALTPSPLELSASEALSAFLKMGAQGGAPLDLVGILMSGEVARGVFNSEGLSRWQSRPSHQLDWSVVHSADRAVKCGWAGASWDLSALERKLNEARAQLEALGRPAHTPAPGLIRALLSPSAVHEVMDTLSSWGAWGSRVLREGQSPLERLAKGERHVSPLVSVYERVEGAAPAFESAGEARQEVTLVDQGRWGSPLISPRSGLLEGRASNGATQREVPQTLEMSAGELPMSEALKALGTGVYVSDLWYLNFSDRSNACVTGTTRFATMWVEGGEVVAPLSVMRFDDCLYDLFGERLEALSQERSLFMSTSTYGQRSLESALCPAALCSGFRFTL